MEPYYDHNGITIYHGDCLDVMPTLEPASINAVICDPPYGVTNCAWDSVIPFAPMWENIKRLITPRAAVVLFGSQPFTSALVMSNPKWFKYEWVWEKAVGTGHAAVNDRPLKTHENIVVFAGGAATYIPQKRAGQPYRATKGATPGESREFTTGSIRRGNSDGTRYPRSVQRFNDAKYADIQQHPTQKPLDLLRYLILTYTNPGDLVLDFTMGSGTTLVAAKQLGRRAIGIELDERYCEIAALRLQQEVMELV